MKKKLFVSLLIVLMTASLVFAGGSSESSSGKTELRMLWWGGDGRHTPTLEALDLYMEENPDVTIEGEYQGWDGYYQKIVTQLAGGTAADVLQIDQPWFNELCSRGDIFVEIDPSIIDISGFEAQLLEYGTYEGKLYGLPTGVNVNTMVVDKNLLAKCGIDPDTVWTWENIITEGRKVHETDPSYYFNGCAPDTFRYWWEMYMAQVAGGVVDEDKNVMFTYEQALQAFEYFKQWFDLGIVAPFAQTSLFYQHYQDNPDWINNKMAVGWEWISSMENSIGSRDLETTTLPVFEGAANSGVLMRPAQIYVIPKSTKNATETQKLVNFLFNDPDAVDILGTCRSVPATSNAREVLAEKGKISSLVQKATDEGTAQAGWAQSTWQMNSDVCQAMQDVIDEFGYGRITPAEAASKMITSLESTLARL